MKSERGQSFIELGLSMVFLLVLLAGVMDLGRVIFTYIALRDAVQEGAAYAAIEPDNCGLAIKRIREHTSGAVDLNEINADISVTITYRVANGAGVTTDYTCDRIRTNPDPSVPYDAITNPYLTLTWLYPASDVENNICPGNRIEVVATYNNFVIATPFIGAMVGGQSINFDTRVVESIVVNPTPKTGVACAP